MCELKVPEPFDPERWVKAYSNLLGFDPNLIVPRAKVERVRQASARLRQAKRLAWRRRAILRLRFLASGRMQLPPRKRRGRVA